MLIVFLEEWSSSGTTFPVYRLAKLTDRRRGQRALVPLTGILQQLTPKQRTHFTIEDENLRKVEHEAGLEGIQTIPTSYSEDDSTDMDYVPAPPMPSMSPRAHDAKAGGSGTPHPKTGSFSFTGSSASLCSPV